MGGHGAGGRPAHLHLGLEAPADRTPHLGRATVPRQELDQGPQGTPAREALGAICHFPVPRAASTTVMSGNITHPTGQPEGTMCHTHSHPQSAAHTRSPKQDVTRSWGCLRTGSQEPSSPHPPPIASAPVCQIQRGLNRGKGHLHLRDTRNSL